jgi:diguanylate cyclase (GGDEF)-like protein
VNRLNETVQDLKSQLEAERRVSSSFTELARAIVSPLLTRKDIYQMVLDQARALTNSDHGFVSSIDPQSGAHVSHTLTKMKSDGCSAPLTQGVFPSGPHKQYGTLWGYGLNKREAFFTNDPASHPASQGLPSGHVPMRNFLSVPVVFHALLLGQIALANSNRDYTQNDIEVIEKLAVFYAVVLRNHLWAKELQEANETLEHKVETRTQELITANEKLTKQYEEILAVQEKNAALNRTLAEMNESLGQLVEAKTADLVSANKILTEQYAELTRVERELQIYATIDGLTGIFNRRHFLSRADEELKRIARYGGAGSLLMLDIDHFKKVNDSFGHAVGDAAIQRVARLCAETLRSTDLVGRIGGEEFAMLLIETDLAGAGQVAERLRQLVQDDPFGADQGISCPLRISIGVAETQFAEESLAALMVRADDALYRAKNEGRNRVITA